jgi:hypothetical protein
LLQGIFDAHGDLMTDTAHLPAYQGHAAAAHLDDRVRTGIEQQGLPHLEIHHVVERHRQFVEHRLDVELRAPQFGRQMAFPNRVAAELFAHEHLQQQFADRFERRVRQQQFDAPAAVFHVDAKFHKHGGIRRTRDRRKARIDLKTVEIEADG